MTPNAPSRARLVAPFLSERAAEVLLAHIRSTDTSNPNRAAHREFYERRAEFLSKTELEEVAAGVCWLNAVLPRTRNRGSPG
jgi:hypothetical protein